MRLVLLFILIAIPIKADFLELAYSSAMDDATYYTSRKSFVKIEKSIYYFEKGTYRHNFLTLKDIQDSTKTITLDFPDVKSRVERPIWEVRMMAYNDGILAAQVNQSICIFRKDKDFEFQKIYNLEEIFQEMQSVYTANLKIENDKIIGTYDHFSTFNKEGEEFYIWTIDLKKDDNHKILCIDPPAAYYYTLFQPRRVMDYSNGKILTSEIIKYQMYIRDMNGNITDSISRDIDDWVSPKLSKEYGKQNPYETIRQIQSDTNKLSLIHRADFLTDNKILVTYSMEHKREEGDNYTYNMYYDIWEKRNGKWILSVKDVSKNKMESGDYTKQNLDFGMDYYIFDEYIVHRYYNLKSYSDYRIIVRYIE